MKDSSHYEALVEIFENGSLKEGGKVGDVKVSILPIAVYSKRTDDGSSYLHQIYQGKSSTMHLFSRNGLLFGVVRYDYGARIDEKCYFMNKVFIGEYFEIAYRGVDP